jgi:hypothetical protein
VGILFTGGKYIYLRSHALGVKMTTFLGNEKSSLYWSMMTHEAIFVAIKKGKCINQWFKD